MANQEDTVTFHRRFYLERPGAGRLPIDWKTVCHFRHVGSPNSEMENISGCSEAIDNRRSSSGSSWNGCGWWRRTSGKVGRTGSSTGCWRPRSNITRIWSSCRELFSVRLSPQLVHDDFRVCRKV